MRWKEGGEVSLPSGEMSRNKSGGKLGGGVWYVEARECLKGDGEQRPVGAQVPDGGNAGMVCIMCCGSNVPTN